MATMLRTLTSIFLCVVMVTWVRPDVVVVVGRAPAAGGASFTEVQQVNYASTAGATSHDLTIATPTANNLLVLTVVADDTVTTPSGWTLISAGVASDFCLTYIFYKVATGGESTTLTITVASGHLAAVFLEYSGTATASVEDTSDVNVNGLDPTVCGPITTATADTIMVAVVGISGNTPDISSWSGTFTQEANIVCTGTGTLVRNGTATRKVAATGTYQTDADLTGSGNSNNASAMAAFKITNP